MEALVRRQKARMSEFRCSIRNEEEQQSEATSAAVSEVAWEESKVM